MNYYSTRGADRFVKGSKAINQGISPDGGLYVPAEKLPAPNYETMAAFSYSELAATLLSPFLDEFPYEKLLSWTQQAYGLDRFDTPETAPVHRLTDGLHVLELWHGPTCAFKDMALQLMPYLLAGSMEAVGEPEEVVILVATSGDTGKAALEGFADVPGTKLIVFYPEDGVSEVQKMQMITQEGSNVFVVAVRGNFDDTQGGVKTIFTDKGVNLELNQMGFRFSSANSINWGRLAPQIVYYFSSYLRLLNDEAISPGQPVHYVVPTGNFGNILAGYYARKMGLPVGKLICASNRNHILTDFIRTGEYNANRAFHRTLSPSMDILISSNLERLLFELTGHDAARIKGWMHQLQTRGHYTVDEETMKIMQALFWADFADDRETAQAIRDVHEKHRYSIDTHTAVGLSVYEKYRQATGDMTPCIVISTASPFKFNLSVSQALLGEKALRGRSEFELLNMLSDYTGQAIPRGLRDLENQPILHDRVIDKGDMEKTVFELLGRA